MINSFGRNLHKLRVQLLDACNMRCLYCMPDNYHFQDVKGLLSSEEIFEICEKLHLEGVDEIRLTGGEPLLRKDFLEIAEKLSNLKLKKLGVTTNAYYLTEKLLNALSKTLCKYINISCDSLNAQNFHKITGKNCLGDVLNNILFAKKLGFHVKVNAVIMKGINDQEMTDFVKFSEINNIPVRFLEVMKIGPKHRDFSNKLISKAEMMNRLNESLNLLPVFTVKDSTSQDYKTENGGQVGFIASETESFCSSCSRLRLTAKGELRSCLFKNDGLSVRGLDKNQLKNVLQKVSNMKPQGRIESIDQAMVAIGG